MRTTWSTPARWISLSGRAGIRLYEVACNYIKMMIEGEALHAVPYGGVNEAELAVLRNEEPVNQQEAAELTQCRAAAG